LSDNRGPFPLGVDKKFKIKKKTRIKFSKHNP
jgi:hypothetical protein